MTLTTSALLLALFLAAIPAAAQAPAAPHVPMAAQPPGMDDSMTTAAGLVPPGIMVGRAGEWMISYEFMFDNMNGNLVGTSSVTDLSILNRFSAAPTAMTMPMQMATIMYAPTDRLTVMAMLPFARKSMQHINARRNAVHGVDQRIW